MEDVSQLIGIGGVIVSILVGILSSLVTWLVAKKGQEIKKLSYNITTNSILSKQLIHLDKSPELTITYGNNKLEEPCLLSVEITNTGNTAICNPPLRIKVADTNQIIPGYIEDVPKGYEKLWKLDINGDSEGTIEIQHINPKQVINAKFYLSKPPEEEPIFMCPMENLYIQPINKENYKNRNIISKIPEKNDRTKIFMTILTIFFVLTLDTWNGIFSFVFQNMGLLIYPEYITYYLIGLLVITTLLCFSNINKYLRTHKKPFTILRFISTLTSIFLLILILNNIWIKYYLTQTFIAILTLLTFAFNLFTKIVHE